MKLVVLGATGPSGLLFLTEALKADNTVTAVVRNPGKIPPTLKKNDKLTIVEGDIFSADSLAPHFEGADAVVSCLGYPGWLPPFTTLNLHLPSGKAIVEAMKKSGVRRLVAMTSVGTKSEAGASPFLEWFVKPVLIGRQLADMARMEDYLTTETEHIDYTCARPPRLIDGAAVEQEVKVNVDHQFVPNASGKMPRANVATFLLTCITSDEYFGKCVAIDV